MYTCGVFLNVSYIYIGFIFVSFSGSLKVAIKLFYWEMIKADFKRFIRFVKIRTRKKV